MLSIKNKCYIFLCLFVLIACKKEISQNECIPLYQFNQKIVFDGYTDSELKQATIICANCSIIGKISFNENEKNQKKSGRIYFESTNDTICKKDTLTLRIANKEYVFTEIIQKSVKVSLGNDRPGFIEFKINGKKFVKSGVIKK